MPVFQKRIMRRIDVSRLVQLLLLVLITINLALNDILKEYSSNKLYISCFRSTL